MKASEFRGMSDDQLALTLADTEKHLFQLRFQSATDRLETPSEIAKAKVDIARIKTEQRRRELDVLKTMSVEDLDARLGRLEAKTEGPGQTAGQTGHRPADHDQGPADRRRHEVT